MLIKYKLSDLSRNLSVDVKELIDFYSQNGGEVKKPQVVLTEDELNEVLEKYISDHSVDNFDEYYKYLTPTVKGKNPQSKPITEEAPEVQKPEKTVTPKQKGKKPETKKAEEKKPVEKKPQSKDNKPRQVAPLKHQEKTNRFENKPVFEREKSKAKKPEHFEPKKTDSKQNVKKSFAASDESAVTRQTNVRHIDTKAAVVELDKYNEHYDQIAPASKFNKDNVIRKQKLTQRSQQRGRGQYNRYREDEAEKLKKIQAMQQKKQQLKLELPEEIVVSDLALMLKVTASDVVKRLMMLGAMATVNDVIDYDTAALVAMEYGAKVEKQVVVTIEERLIDDTADDDKDLVPRSPVVVVMGHVDHGKTSLLDAIRHSDVTATEAGGITQHIGAYKVNVDGRDVTFLDTPGHAAFTSMRARGAQVTDIAIIVVAADDGIMPQTVEAINHAKAAGVSIIVAINKMDKEGADPDRVKEELTKYELVPEEWGGDTICVPVSAVKKIGIKELLDMIILVSDVKELRANPSRLAKGTVIEAKLDKGRGPVATILVQNGTLKNGDIVIAGTAVGKVRAMTNENGRKISTAGPSTPVEITGLDEVPSAGDIFNAVEDEHLARQLVEERKNDAKEEQFKSYQKVTLDNLFNQIAEGEMKELSVIVKADVQGSVEAVIQSLEKLSNDEVRVRVIHGAVGAITDGDVMLADASNAIIVGFNVRPDPTASESAAQKGVDMRMYRIIYDCIGEIESAMKGMLAPKFRDVDIGRITVRQVYKISNVGIVAGCYVDSGKVTRGCKIRVVRDGVVLAEDEMSSLKRFKDDVKEVAQGYECGIVLEKYHDVKEGDIFEAYVTEEYRED